VQTGSLEFMVLLGNCSA